MFEDLLSQEFLSAVAGYQLRAPLSLLQTGTVDQNGDRHILFVAEAGKSHPFALVKWARGPARQDLEREQAALVNVHARGAPTLTASCPQCWGPFEAGGDAAILVQRCLPGRSVYAQLRSDLWPRRLVRHHFDMTAKWLEVFTAATRGPTRPFDEPMIESYIEQPLRAAAARFRSANLTEAVVESICNAARLHLGRPVSLVAEHGDLWIANLLLSRSAIGIVDWEHFVPETLPGFDILFFCVTYAMHFPWVPFGWERAEIAFARAFLQPTWMNAYIGWFLDRACASAELPREIVPILLPVMLARMALRQSQRLTAGTSGEHSWLNMLQSWLTRTGDNWLDQWAKAR